MFAAGLLLGMAGSVQAQFTLSAEVRPRAEFRNGFKRLREAGTDPAFFVEQRTRLYADYRSARIQLYLAMQDVRIWGNADQIYKSDPALTNFYEAWAQVNFNDRMSLRMGRQALDYDNARILGDLDWAQQGRSHDALLFTCQNPKLRTRLHVGAAYNQNVPFEPTRLSGTFYSGVNNYKSMQFAWWHKNFDAGNLSLLIHNDGRQIAADSSMGWRQTYGGAGQYRSGKLEFAAEFFFQGGRNATGRQVRALLASAQIRMNTSLTPITLGADYLSGSAPGEEIDHAFDPLYGTHHKFYGFMDYFYVGNFHGQASTPSGLIDPYIKTSFKLSKNATLQADLHHFLSPVAITNPEDPGETLPASLGTEIDLVFVMNPFKDVRLFVGYSQMFATESMEAIKGGGDRNALQNWAWAMIAFKPQLFTTKKEE